MIWNFPFEIQYRSMSPAGWPRLVLTCYGKSADGTEYIKSYGSTNIPIEPGVHIKTVRMFSPIQSGSWWEYFGFYKVSD